MWYGGDLPVHYDRHAEDDYLGFLPDGVFLEEGSSTYTVSFLGDSKFLTNVASHHILTALLNPTWWTSFGRHNIMACLPCCLLCISLATELCRLNPPNVILRLSAGNHTRRSVNRAHRGY